MTDSPFPGFGFIMPMSPEQKAEMEEMHNRHEMEALDIRHTIADAIRSLNQQQTYAFRMIFGSLSTAPSRQARNMASFYEGTLTSRLDTEFDVCIGCGKNHDEEAAKLFMEENEPSGTTGKSTGPKLHGTIIEGPDGIVGQQVLFDFAEAGLTEEDFAHMEEYNLDDLRDEDTHKLLGFICKGCGQRYVSIEDRMLREPGVGGCSGCQQKAMWG